MKQAITILILIMFLVGGYFILNLNSAPKLPTLAKETLKTHYLIDQEYLLDKQSLFGTIGHLLVFNPGDRDADLTITVYYESSEPKTFSLKAKARITTSLEYQHLPIKPQPNTIFAFKVESTEPVICQQTNGWNNTGNNYKFKPQTKSPKGIRETAKSYMAINRLSQEWYIADGIVINMPGKTWIKESEWALILNTNDKEAEVSLLMYYGGRKFYNKPVEHKFKIPANRLKRIFMDELAVSNRNYGARFISNQPIAVQWQRTVKWYDSPELMGYWSVPAVPLP